MDGTILKLSKYTDDKEAALIIEAEFNVKDFVDTINKPENSDFTAQALTYLLKQKLMDSGASNVGDFEGKILAAKNRWKELLEGKWTGERTNATGAAEDKKLINNVKSISKVVSLEGLIMKKTLYPNTFTPKDEVKLQELMEAAVAKR